MSLKPKFWNADKIVSFSAILISLATMAIYLYQTHLIQKQQHASVMPYLSIVTSSYSQSHFLVQLSNDGLGPAMIDKVKVHYLKKEYVDCDLPTFFDQKNPVKKDSLLTSASTWSNIGEGQLIPAGKTINLIEINKNSEMAKTLSNYFWNNKTPIELEIIYSSIYGDRWSVRGIVSRPTKIED